MNYLSKQQDLYWVAEGQAGYFTTKQAAEIGFDRRHLYRDVKAGRLLRAARGVYRYVTFPASRYEDLHVALLLGGDNSVVGYQSALAVYKLSDILPTTNHVILPRSERYRASRAGIRWHFPRVKLTPEDVLVYEGLRTTTPARTIADVVYMGMETDQVFKAVAQSISTGLSSRGRLLEQASRRGERTRDIILAAIKSAE